MDKNSLSSVYELYKKDIVLEEKRMEIFTDAIFKQKEEDVNERCYRHRMVTPRNCNNYLTEKYKNDYETELEEFHRSVNWFYKDNSSNQE